MMPLRRGHQTPQHQKAHASSSPDAASISASASNSTSRPSCGVTSLNSRPAGRRSSKPSSSSSSVASSILVQQHHQEDSDSNTEQPRQPSTTPAQGQPAGDASLSLSASLPSLPLSPARIRSTHNPPTNRAALLMLCAGPSLPTEAPPPPPTTRPRQRLRYPPPTRSRPRTATPSFPLSTTPSFFSTALLSTTAS